MESDCEPQSDWLPYTVQEDDTLLSLALAADIALIELREGNCFNPIRSIFPGEQLMLPRRPQSADMGAPVFPAAGERMTAVGCESELASIHAPPAMTELKGIFALIGNAMMPEGGSYRLSLRPAWSDRYTDYLEFDSPVEDDVLGLINVEIFGPGLHWLRLSLIDDTDEIIQESFCEQPVVFAAPQAASRPRSTS